MELVSVMQHVHCCHDGYQQHARALHRLAKKRVADKKLAVTVFSFPPDKGNVGTAAYLNVFGSIFKVLQDLKREGYTVGELPADERALIDLVSLLAGSQNDQPKQPAARWALCRQHSNAHPVLVWGRLATSQQCGTLFPCAAQLHVLQLFG